jgi:hypothetical protein
MLMNPEIQLHKTIDSLPRDEFGRIYQRRWGQETYYDRIKNIFEVERFSGISDLAIRQDFYGVIFLAPLDSVLTKAPQAALTQRDAERHTQTRARVHRAISYVTLVDYVVQLLGDSRFSSQETLDIIHHLLQTNPTRNREGRVFERPTLKHSRRLRFHRYTKRIQA